MESEQVVRVAPVLIHNQYIHCSKSDLTSNGLSRFQHKLFNPVMLLFQVKI